MDVRKTFLTFTSISIKTEMFWHSKYYSFACANKTFYPRDLIREIIHCDINALYSDHECFVKNLNPTTFFSSLLDSLYSALSYDKCTFLGSIFNAIMFDNFFCRDLNFLLKNFENIRWGIFFFIFHSHFCEKKIFYCFSCMI